MKEPKIRPLAERKNKVTLADFARVPGKVPGFGEWFESLPDLLGASQLKELVRTWRRVRSEGRLAGIAMGAHVLKVGLQPLLIDLMKRGYIQHLATNGAGAIHDYEFALQGASSEDVGENLVDGSFGFWRETFDGLSGIAKEAARDGLGFGAAVGRHIVENNLPHKEVSIFAAAWEMKIPVTVHVAVGCDIVHMDPALDGAALGAATLQDFRVICDSVQKLEKGLWINLGSAVLMPEVFLKAVSTARNLGRLSDDFTTANLDILMHYRAIENVVQRPPKRGLRVTGHHEILLPILHQALLADAPETK
ncbi:MAG: hypothetical protein CSA62_15380 [Planctomycetota bacterium]|nr:MAG: hypothetical protein CSA62_15380 [Planctomycetota bacterium]